MIKKGFTRFDGRWQRSCFIQRHNLVSRGERELRGERHGKGGRSLFTTIASSFFIPLLLFTAILAHPGNAGAQMRIEAGIGFAVSGDLVKDQVATPTLRARFGNSVDESVTATLTPAPEFRLGVAVPLRAGTDALFTGSWSSSTLRAHEGGAERDVQNVSVMEAVIAMRHRFGAMFEAGAGFGAAYFKGSDEALFRGGASIAPLVEAGAGAGWNMGAHRVHARALAQLHRFDTNAIADAGGRSGNVMRYGVQASFTWHGAVTR